MEARDAGAGTLARGLAILRLFDPERPELTQSEIAEALALPLSTVHRLCATLTAEGFLSRPRGGRQFRLGNEIARWRGPHRRDPEHRVPPAPHCGLSSPGPASRPTWPPSSGARWSTWTRSRAHTCSPPAPRPECGSRSLHRARQVLSRRTARHRGRPPARRRPLHPENGSDADQLDSAAGLPGQGPPHRVSASIEEYEIGLVSLAIALPSTEDGRQYAINISLPTARATNLPALERLLRSAAADLGRR